MSPRRILVAATAFLGLVFAGSAASAIPIRGVGQVGSETTDLRERLRTQFEQSFGRLDLLGVKAVAPSSPAAGPNAGAPAVDPFPGLAAGEFAGYASATVNHTAAHLVGNDVDRDAN